MGFATKMEWSKVFGFLFSFFSKVRAEAVKHSERVAPQRHIYISCDYILIEHEIHFNQCTVASLLFRLNPDLKTAFVHDSRP